MTIKVTHVTEEEGLEKAMDNLDLDNAQQILRQMFEKPVDTFGGENLTHMVESIVTAVDEGDADFVVAFCSMASKGISSLRSVHRALAEVEKAVEEAAAESGDANDSFDKLVH